MRATGRRPSTAFLLVPLLTALALLVSSCGSAGPDARTMGPALPADAPFTHPASSSTGPSWTPCGSMPPPGGSPG